MLRVGTNPGVPSAPQVATRRTDTYGRYLADLKYLPGETDPHVVLAQGIFLNQRLLDVELAVPYVG